jgi:hypothetical protein
MEAIFRITTLAAWHKDACLIDVSCKRYLSPTFVMIPEVAEAKEAQLM